jgi:hypothetical protein
LPLTPEKLRELSGLDLSDEQAEEVIWSLTQYARIVYDFTVQQEQLVNTKAGPLRHLNECPGVCPCILLDGIIDPPQTSTSSYQACGVSIDGSRI